MSAKVYEMITDRLIKEIEKSGKLPWRMPWNGQVGAWGAHKNLASGKAYTGINAIMTATAGFSSPYWLTLKQANQLGGKVKAGSKGTPIVFVTKTEKETEAGEKQAFTLMRYYTVFNLDQVEGIAAPETEKTAPGFSPIQACEEVLKATQVRCEIRHAENSAYYSPRLDFINMPKKENFGIPAEYYSTLFHELGHATGHPTRLNRTSLEKVAGFGSHEYSKEELVAEMTAAFLCGHVGIDNHTLGNSAAYLQSWIKVLKGDSKLLISAASQAQKAADYILNR